MGKKTEMELLEAVLLPKMKAGAQLRLDQFARTRQYDGILSAASYATSTVPKFAAEGQYAVEIRDATWNALYAMWDEVKQGLRPVPKSFADIEPELPPMAWPETEPA